jgi:SOS-response transcriptional repressor LexA
MTAMTDHDDAAELAAMWNAFVAEAAELLATDPDEMMTSHVEQQLERLSDPLVDLIGDVERNRMDSAAYEDPRFAAWLADQGTLDAELLSPAEIKGLSRRVVADVEAVRLGVLTPFHMPDPRRLDEAGPVSGVVEDAVARHESVLIELDVAAGTGRELWDVECELCIPLPAELPRGRHLALRVSGESMEPLVHAGDVIVVRLGVDVARDTVIVAREPDDGYVVKRVGRVTRRSLELLSLNAAFPPLHIPRVANVVLGTVVLRWCAHGGERELARRA